jgi:small subunit ribosomal protein S1
MSETDREKNAETLKTFLGEEMSVKVITVNSRTNKLIVSERETMSANVKELLAKYEIGQTVDGMVSGLADFGIFMRFVDNPEIEGLVHISEIDHRIIDNPKEVMKLNETAKVKIIDIKDGRVFLSLKALKPNPWDTAAASHKTGDALNGKVYKFNPFGVIVDLPSGLQGMVHISEFGGVDEMKKALTLGESYDFIVDSVKPEERRIILKLKK